MRRTRLPRCAAQLLTSQTRTAATSTCRSTPFSASVRAAAAAQAAPSQLRQTVRTQSTAAAAAAASSSSRFNDEEYALDPEREPYPSPLPERAQKSAKLHALHSRMCLPETFPIETLARCLVNPSADSNPHFNNANLALVGSSLISYHVSERLIVKYPRLPMAILFESMRALAGPETLQKVAMQLGIEQAAAPGEEVDPGYLQYSLNPEDGVTHTAWGYVRAESKHLDRFKWRRGMSSRVVYDNEFGDTVHKSTKNPHDTTSDADMAAEERIKIRNEAHASAIRAIVGALYAHAGRESARAFIESHVLSRHFDADKLFHFKLPTRELAMLCAREGFEPPVARLLSSTGRHSNTPVYVVGIYSGQDKLGEGYGASLDFARLQASMNSLKAWYLYSPGRDTAVPSDMLRDDAKKWEPVHIDMGEVI